MLTGLTIGEVVEKLLKLPQDALFVTEAGEATVGGVTNVQLGYVYQFSTNDTYGMSNYLFDKEMPEFPKSKPQTAVYVGS